MDQPIRESGPHLAEILNGSLRGDGPLYRLLASGLKHAIDRGEIPLGTVLPPERALAQALSVSRATVVAAYDRLKADGWLDSQRGSGTWVRHPSDPSPTGVDAVATGRVFLAPDGAHQRSDPGEQEPNDDMIDFAVAAVAGADIVSETISRLEPDEVTRLVRHHGYVPQGLRTLREAVADRYLRVGLATSADQVIVTTGAHQALSLVARQVLQPGDAVLVESPTFPGALDVFRRFGARAIALPVDQHGARTDVLDDLITRTSPTLIYVAPHFHNPTGTIMPIERRRQLGELASQAGIVVVEDMALADVVIDDVTPPPPIAAVTPAATVHTIGSTAKLFWAGLRIGWLRSPESWTVRMLATKTVADLGSPLISQLVVAKLLGQYDVIREQRRRLLRPRRDQMCELVRQLLPEWTFDVPVGGLSIWASLPHGNADEFAEVAARNGVSIVPGPALSVDEGNRRSVRLVFARPEADIAEGMQRLAAAWSSYAPSTSIRPSARLLV